MIRECFALFSCAACLANACLSQQVDLQVVHSAQQEALQTEYRRAVKLLLQAGKEHWTPEHYRTVLETPGFKTVLVCQSEIQRLALPRYTWDERMPFEVEVRRALAQCEEERSLLTGASSLSLQPTSTPKSK